MDQQQAAPYPPVAGYPPVTGYPPSANYAVHHQSSYPSAPVVRDAFGNPYVYAQEVKPGHAPDCRYYGSPDRRHRNGLANALAAIFIVCWCCTWPCHGPCCCGL